MAANRGVVDHHDLLADAAMGEAMPMEPSTESAEAAPSGVTQITSVTAASVIAARMEYAVDDKGKDAHSSTAEPRSCDLEAMETSPVQLGSRGAIAPVVKLKKNGHTISHSKCDRRQPLGVRGRSLRRKLAFK